MYIFARVMTLRRASGAVAALVFQGAGFMLVSAAVFPMIIGGAAWLPLLLAVVEMVIRAASTPRGAGKTLPWVALGALALGCQILAGHIEITYHPAGHGTYAAWRLLSRPGSSARRRRPERAGDNALWPDNLLAMAPVLLGVMLAATFIRSTRSGRRTS